MPLGEWDGLGDQVCVVVDLALLAGQIPTGPGGDVAGKHRWALSLISVISDIGLSLISERPILG